MRVIEFSRKFSEEAFGKMVDFINTTLRRGITFEDNMSVDIVSVTLERNGGEVTVNHNLRVTPKYRIILDIDGEAIITRGDTPWNDRQVSFKAEANGLVGTISVLIAVVRS